MTTSTHACVVDGAAAPPGSGKIPVSNGAGGYTDKTVAQIQSRFASFSGLANNGGSSAAQIVNGNGGITNPTIGTALKYPAIEATSKASLVVRVIGNTSSTAVNFSLTKDGGVTPVGTVNYGAGATGNQQNIGFAFPLAAITDGFDLMVSFGAGGAGQVSFTASVELIP